MPGVTGIDPATVTGWAHVEENMPTLCGTWNLKPGPRDGAGMLFLRMRSNLRLHLTDTTPDLVVYEATTGRFRGLRMQEMHHGLAAEIQAACEEAGVAYVGVNPSTLKKWASGSGNANKETMVALANEAWEKESKGGGTPFLPIADDNVADAFHLALAGRAFLAGELHL